jgi:hypothetical protein
MDAIPDYFPFVEGRVATIECAIASAIRHQVPANLLLAIQEAEGGRNGLAKRNTNGTIDHGTMQWNSKTLTDYRMYGITAKHVSTDGCYALDLAAHKIAGHLAESRGSFWERAAMYHSRSPRPNQEYQDKIKPLSKKWGRILKLRYSGETFAAFSVN